MKKWISIVFVCGLTILSACHTIETRHAMSLSSVASPELSAIDSLMWQRPDSALTVLLDFAASPKADSLDVFDGHYFQLLVSELLYKNDYEQSNRPDLLRAVSYFDSLSLTVTDKPIKRHLIADADLLSPTRSGNLVFLDARAHYINGVGYYERDSIVEACKEYLKALEVMENNFEEDEMVGNTARSMALTYTHLTGLFFDLYLHEQALYFGKLSLPYYQKQESSTWHLAWILGEIGSQYQMLDVLDSADYYYQSAIETLRDTNILMYRDVATLRSYLYYRTANDPQTALKQLYVLAASSESEKEYLARCLTIGEVYFHENQYDSAWVYLSKVYENTDNVESKKQSAEWLVEICKAKGRNANVLEYAEFLVPFANLEENQSAIKSQLTELYKVCGQERQERLYQREKKKNLTWALVIVGCSLLVIFVITILYHKNRKRKQHLENQIKEKQYTHEIQQKALSERLKNSNETLRNALKRIEEYESQLESSSSVDLSQTDGKDRYEAFMQTPVCLEILDKVNLLNADKRKALKTDANIKDYLSFALSKPQLALLSKAVEFYFPKLICILKSKYPPLSHKDWPYIYLYLLQLDKMSICVFLQESYHTCRRYTMKLEHAFNCQQGLTTFLLEQINAL